MPFFNTVTDIDAGDLVGHETARREHEFPFGVLCALASLYGCHAFWTITKLMIYSDTHCFRGQGDVQTRLVASEQARFYCQ